MPYDKNTAAEAWRTFVTTGEIDESVVRPEVARSWKRCRAAGVNPWSSDFPAMDEATLEEKRKLYAHSLEANQPVMRMLLALLQCNVSLTDQENFVFEFFTPLSYYPRTFGTYLREDQVGNGNATTVAYERKPIRFDGFEHYRAVVQGYSGVSAPFLDVKGNFFGALNLNSPFDPLPECALEMCKMGVALANDLYARYGQMWARLRTMDFFKPLVELMDNPVLVLDTYGHILLANEAMMPYVPDYGDYAYGEQSLAGYLAKSNSVKEVLSTPFAGGMPMRVEFQKAGKKQAHALDCLHRNTIQFKNGVRVIVLVFRNESTEAEEAVPAQVSAPDGEAPALRTHAKAVSPEVVDYIGQSDEWLEVDRVVDRIAPINTNALLLGETGTGKEMIARAIHRRSGRPGNFVAINCGAIPRDLFAAELFGYEHGAFTGAKEEGALGKIEAANHGTLLLDEIGEMPLELQVGLLRVIQEQSVTRLGSTESVPLDVRFLAATNQDLQTLIDARAFRADLYYRLSMIEIKVPPLRKRDGDVALLADYFNRKVSDSLGLEYSPLPDEVTEAMRCYSWPGNVRELSNVVERSLILAGTGSKVSFDDMPAHIANARSLGLRFEPAIEQQLLDSLVPDSQVPPAASNANQLPPEELADRKRIMELLQTNDGNLSKVANELGISRTTLYKRMEKYHLRIKVTVTIDE